MTKEVWVNICGMHFVDEQLDPVETIASGEYYNRNGKHYILYEEAVEGTRETIKNKIKISNDSVEITKRGVSNVHMTFRTGAKYMANYQTPYGPMLLGMDTHTIQIQETEDQLDVRMEYALVVEEQKLSDCSLTMKICSKETGTIGLL